MKRILIFSFFVMVWISSSNAQSIILDKALGEENAKMVESQMGIYTNQEMTSYVNNVGQKLVANLEDPLFEYTFHIVPEMAPNAFALPGGYIYITTGLVPLLQNESELACILAHEIIHSNNRHSIKQIKNSIIPRLFELPGNLLGAINQDLGALFNAPIVTSNTLISASYSRKYETEADTYGVALAAKSGYDPSAMKNILSRLNDAIETATGYKEEKSYFADHPFSPDRYKNLDLTSKTLKINHSRYISDNFLFEFDGILFGNSPAKGIIKENTFLHPDIDFYIEFPKDWDIENQPSNVGAYNPDRNAAVFYSLEQAGKNPEQAGKEFIEMLDDDYKSKVTMAEPYELSNKKGFLVSFTEHTENGNMYAYVLWLPLKNQVFKIMGIAPLEYRDELEASASSLRNLTIAEKQSIKQTVLKVVKAIANETYETLATKAGNKLNNELTAIINSKNLDDKFEEGELIKIVVEEAYPSK